MKKIKVLVFPGSTEIGLEIHKSLSKVKNIELYSASSNIPNHAPYVFFRYYSLPSVNEDFWLESLNSLILKLGIEFIYPAHDDVIVALAENCNKIPARIITSPLQTCLISRSKSKTYDHLADVLPVPKTFAKIDDIESFPIFAKPDRGQGSQDTHIVVNKQEFIKLKSTNKNYIFSEYLQGKEFTVDCFSDREKGLLFCSGRERIRTRNGISMSSQNISGLEVEFNEYARKISSKMQLYGAWFFQLKKDNNGTLKLLEVAPRIAGTMALNRNKGVNFPMLSLYECERIPIEIILNQYDLTIDRALVNRYQHSIKYETVYVDLDDTIIIDKKINTDLIKFLYQCLNNNIKIILITKHAGNLNETLKKYRITNIFDEIKHIDKSVNKSSCVTSKNAIFIDDSFRERQEVYKKTGIPTFDCSMLECLLDDRS